jgi:catechol 2,3-dioxygenase-like lactoylglutathione lyase family enzyme
MPLGHLGMNVRDVAGARAYYDRLMPLIDFVPFVSDDDHFSYRPANDKPGTFVFFYRALEAGAYSRHRPGLQHLAFMARTRAQVHQVHEWARAQGAEIIYPPREFPEYHPGYYATFWHGPEGFMLEVVCHREEDHA